MKIDGKATRTIWLADDGRTVEVIDQTKLPFSFKVLQLRDVEDAAIAIERMVVRGAPLIGAAAAYGVALAMAEDPSSENLTAACQRLIRTRPTAVNLRWAIDEMNSHLSGCNREDRVEAAYRRAAEICDEDVEINASIGRNGSDSSRRLPRTRHPESRLTC